VHYRFQDHAQDSILQNYLNRVSVVVMAQSSPIMKNRNMAVRPDVTQKSV
jgi:hypothetical protein